MAKDFTSRPVYQVVEGSYGRRAFCPSDGTKPSIQSLAARNLSLGRSFPFNEREAEMIASVLVQYSSYVKKLCNTKNGRREKNERGEGAFCSSSRTQVDWWRRCRLWPSRVPRARRKKRRAKKKRKSASSLVLSSDERDDEG